MWGWLATASYLLKSSRVRYSCDFRDIKSPVKYPPGFLARLEKSIISFSPTPIIRWFGSGSGLCFNTCRSQLLYNIIITRCFNYKTLICHYSSRFVKKLGFG